MGKRENRRFEMEKEAALLRIRGGSGWIEVDGLSYYGPDPVADESEFSFGVGQMPNRARDYSKVLGADAGSGGSGVSAIDQLRAVYWTNPADPEDSVERVYSEWEQGVQGETWGRD